MRKLILLFLVLTATGCVGWTKTAGIHEATKLGFMVKMPDDWMQLNRPNAVMISKDGVLLQNILIRRDAIGSDLEFTKKRFQNSMLPHEAAEVYLDNERMNAAKFNFSLAHNLPTELSGLPAFNVEYTYTTKEGLVIRTACQGVITDQFFYQITYTAPERHYYKRNISTYLDLVKSFKLSQQ